MDEQLDILETERGKSFMAELTALSLKYGVIIDGCGCCGSPYCRDSREKGKYVYGTSGTKPDLRWQEERA